MSIVATIAIAELVLSCLQFTVLRPLSLSWILSHLVNNLGLVFKGAARCVVTGHG